MDHEADAYRTDLMTITRYVLNEQSRNPEARGDLTILLSHIVLGCKFVASAVNKAGLAKLIGLAGETNVQGEEQKKLDVLSNEVFVKALVSSGRTCVLVSEEDEEATFVDPALRGKYCVCFDPLDGSSNIDCGVSIGTIFGIYMIKDKENVTLEDVLQPGKNMVAAGYCMYGSSCTLVLSTGNGVNGFTLDPSLGEFILTHPDIKIPKKGKIYSVNEGNAKNWDEPTAKFVEKCKFPKDGSSPKSLRYIGSMVADVHRTLLYGGVFLYPADKKSPNGKLRVLYEVFPMSFLMEQAGGQSFTGKERALDLVPTKIHERSPIFLGSFEDVEEIKGLYAAQAK
ncbi:fructose-1,6-bisphosphatase [Oryza sativa Japonica Group]|uniref:Fructose-1,6-bisphosphatase, cytosolic n=3 Tax=Oryza TaxID=4527 RepID=F16P2_ORYSJ|nr:fructose-1,6-bisphosphatase, cytosolic [Oryza sativa Japonica Group]A2WXB2.2 RecName: Full=Fructose-1,6-bisphosphatase, cytosolic; Short=FBPase; AltName: Full=D-fructose-1,6-bisphosphate 1-phosphohydrolase [Oryza sativa Indica Group]Q0JHF8.2 RecName: Full=Fructose-1,6-bisphosphatase, cytosolic; Short=FBPase; AltName: Full=D-fructose-1,6-bisphosphate 1-phosphohydrolase; AltName: Full=Protein MONOCULM 2 [Oryza sativa Japonica Group]BAA25422.1 fructose-1,6-bisphosphatase [Oryza sativa]ABI94362.